MSGELSNLQSSHRAESHWSPDQPEWTELREYPAYSVEIPEYHVLLSSMPKGARRVQCEIDPSWQA